MLVAFTQTPSPFHPILRTLAITWPQGVIGEEDDLAVAAQVYGDVIRSSMR